MSGNESGLIYSLLETSRSCHEGLLGSIQSALSTIGYEHPQLVLTSVYNFIKYSGWPLRIHTQICLHKVVLNVVNERGNSLEDMNIVEDWALKSRAILLSVSNDPKLYEVAARLLASFVRMSIHKDFIMKDLLNIIKEDSSPPLEIACTFTVFLVNPNDIYDYFKDILNKIVPNMCNIRQDALRTIIIKLIKKISQGLLEISANEDQGIDVDLIQYQEDLAVAYEQMLCSWFKISNANVKNLIIEALGSMSNLLSNDKLTEFCTPTVHAILGSYKKNANPFVLSYSLAMICETYVKNGIEDCLKNHIESMLALLINQACAPLDYNDILAVKNYGEVLRCCETLAVNFPESVIGQILQRLENASYIQRTGSLAVLKHLINTKRIPEGFLKRMFTNLMVVLSDLNSKVIKNMSQLILSLGSKDLLTNETGRPFIEYLVQHAAGGQLEPKGRIDLADMCNEPVKDVCSESLILLCTIPTTVPILWPHMLQYLVGTQYEDSLPVTLKCLAHLTSLDETKAIAEGADSVFNQLTPPIGQESVIVKLLTLSCVPNKSNVGGDCLELLNGLSCHICADLVVPWAEHLPALKVQYRELCASTVEPIGLERFQSALKHFLESTVQIVRNEAFLENLIATLKSDLERHDKNQAYRCFLMSLMGVCLKYVSNDGLATSTLEFLFTTVNHKSSADQESFGSAIGMCASSKTTLVFSKLETWLKAIDSTKRSIFSMIRAQDSRLEEQTFLKTSIVHCLGYIAVLSENDNLAKTVGGPIMLHLLNIINSNKVDVVNDVVVQTISKIARSLVIIPEMSLRQRPIIITHIVNTMKQNENSPICLSNCLRAMRDMVALEPALDVAERSLVLQISITACFTRLGASSTPDLDPSLINCYSILNVLIRTIVQHDPTLGTLDDIITLLRPSIQLPNEILRMKSVDLIHSALCTYQQNIVVNQVQNFAQKPQFLAIIAPRLSDSSMEVKVHAIACFGLLIRIADRYSGHSGEYNDVAHEALESLQERITRTDLASVNYNHKLMGDVICYKFTLDEIARFVQNVNIGLQDPDDEAACGVAQLLSAIFTARGHQMQHFFPKDILEPLYRRLDKVTEITTRFHTIEAICNYAKYKVTRFSNILATFPLPYEPGICETFQRMGGNTDMCVSLLTHFTQVLERTPPYAMQDTADGDRVKIANLLPLSVICAMKEMFRFRELRDTNDERGMLLELAVSDTTLETTKKEINDNFASLFPLLLLWYGLYVDCLAPLHQTQPADAPSGFIPNRDATTLVPARCVLECMRNYLNASGYCENLEHTIDQQLKVPTVESFDSFHVSIEDIVKSFVTNAPEKMSSFVAYLDTHHVFEVQRITVACVFGTLIRLHCNSDFELLKIVITSLINRIHDVAIEVRRTAIKCLSLFDQSKVPEDFEKSSEILATLIGATEIKNRNPLNLNNEVIVEALNGLSAILINMQFVNIEPHVIVLLNKARMFLDNGTELRHASMSLLSALVISVKPCQEYKEIFHTHLLAVFIHLNDPHIPVALTCATILTDLGKHLDTERLSEHVEEHLNSNFIIDYPKFIEDIAPSLVLELGGYISTFVRLALEYFRNSNPSLRKAAIILTANVINNAPDLDITLVKRAAQGLVPMLKDPNIELASAAVLSIALYKSYDMFL